MKRLFLIILFLVSGFIYAQDLTNQPHNSTYGGLLHFSGNTGVSSSFQVIYDGMGIATALQLSTTAVKFPSPFTLGTTSVTASGAEMNYLVGVTSGIQTQLNSKLGLNALSSTATGLTYTSGTGVFSWTPGYVGLTDSMRTYWSAKQPALGFTAENVANKDTTKALGTSDTNYPTQLAVKSYADLRALKTTTVNGHPLSSNVTVTAGDVSALPTTYLDTDTTLTANSDSKIASQKAVKTYIDNNGGGNPDSAIYNAKKILSKPISPVFSDGYRPYYDQASDSIKWTGSTGAVANADSLGNEPPSYYMARNDSTDGTSYTTKKQFNDGQALKLNKADSTETGYATQNDLTGKQATLVSATNIKSINGASILGSGDLTVTDTSKVVKTVTVNGNPLSANVTVTDANLSTTDTTANNSSTSKHGFLPKLPNDSLKVMRGNGTWGTISAISNVRVVVKTADETVNNTITVQDDNELYITVEANSTYIVELTATGGSTVGNTGFKFRFTAPASAIMQGTILNSMSNSNVFGTLYVADMLAEVNNSIWTVGGQTYSNWLDARGVLVTSSTAGTLTLQWAQDYATVTNTYVRKGSYLKITKVQ
jgi:hypothetical protein